MSGRRRVTVGADQLASEARDGSLVVIDARKADEYARGHVPSAVSLPLAELLSDDSPARAGRLFGSRGVSAQTPVAVYDDTFGALASRVAWALEYLGHGDVSLLGVTYGGWVSAGMPTEQGRREPRPAGLEARPREGILATADGLEEAAAAGAAVLDSRERLNYLEQHIPGAVSLPYMALGSPGRVIRPAAEVRRLLEARGVDPSAGIVTYCGSVGTLSGLAYYALREAGAPDVRLYARSFREWRELGRPVERQEHANFWDLSAE